jgi:hypothetical protein
MTEERRLMAVDPRRRRARLVVGLGWTVIQVALFAAVVPAGGFAGLSLGLLVPALARGWGPPVGMLLGVAAGTAVAMALNHGARTGLLRLRLTRLRRTGVSAEATVVSVARRHVRYPRGGSDTVYTVTVRWGSHQGERRYLFPGHGSDRFTEVCRTGAVVLVRHPAGAPDRFVLDIPFAPMMEDLVS